VSVFEDHLELLKKAKNDVFFTPHDEEFGRLTGLELPHAGMQRQTIIQNFARQHKVVLVAKGHPTLVAAPNSDVYTNTTGSPALATAGTGDVLTGVLAALVAQHVSTFRAAELAVYIHGLAGDLAEKEKTEPGVIASDVIDKIPTALQKMSKKT
jgi:NAD(P)H-hydrate epimerase